MRAYRRALEIYQALWQASPENMDIGNGLAAVLSTFGVLALEVGQVAEAEQVYRDALEIYQALWQANPDNARIGYGLAAALHNLGLLLSHTGQEAEAEQVYRRAVEIYQVLWQANPQNAEITVGYAGSLCSVDRFEEAEPLIDRVLREVPQHPYARQLKAQIASLRGVGGHEGQ